MDFSECYQDSVSSIAAAARSGCSQQVRRLIRSGFSADCRDNRGWNALHEAAAAGSKECVQELLSAFIGFSNGDTLPLSAARSRRHCKDYVNSLTHEGESACFLAAKHGHLAVVRLLLKAHANINQLTNDLSCPLYAAVEGGFEKIVELLVRKGAEVNGIHTASCWSCLHQAVYKGHSAIVRILVSVCNLEALDDHLISPLFLAAQYGQRECLQILINAGAYVNQQATDLATPLLIASQEGHQACVDLLLDNGADPNIACSRQWFQLAIHAAAQFGHSGVLKRLIAVTDRSCDTGNNMVSPLYLAAISNQYQCVEVLLKEGFSPDAQDCSDFLGLSSPLSLALSSTSHKPFSESVRLLVAAGAQINKDDWIHALATDQTNLLQLVLEHRWISGPDTSSSHGCSPSCHGKTRLKLQELQDLIHVALGQLDFAPSWLPLLLRAGLEPSLLLVPQMFEQAGSEALNYLLEFVNWSTLPPTLRNILARRREEGTWQPRRHLESISCLAHICRLRVREMLGTDALMRTDIVQELPLPRILHPFLQFQDINYN